MNVDTFHSYPFKMGEGPKEKCCGNHTKLVFFVAKVQFRG